MIHADIWPCLFGWFTDALVREYGVVDMNCRGMGSFRDGTAHNYD